jgi:hypothetical protein
VLCQLEEFRRKKMERQKLAKAVVRGEAVDEPLLGYTNGVDGGSSEQLAMRLDDTRFPPPSPQIHEVPHDAAPALHDEAKAEVGMGLDPTTATSMATLTSHSLSDGTAAGGGSPVGDRTPGAGGTPRGTAATADSPEMVALELEFGTSSPAAGAVAAAAAEEEAELLRTASALDAAQAEAATELSARGAASAAEEAAATAAAAAAAEAMATLQAQLAEADQRQQQLTSQVRVCDAASPPLEPLAFRALCRASFS